MFRLACRRKKLVQRPLAFRTPHTHFARYTTDPFGGSEFDKLAAQKMSRERADHQSTSKKQVSGSVSRAKESLKQQNAHKQFEGSAYDDEIVYDNASVEQAYGHMEKVMEKAKNKRYVDDSNVVSFNESERKLGKKTKERRKEQDWTEKHSEDLGREHIYIKDGSYYDDAVTRKGFSHKPEKFTVSASSNALGALSQDSISEQPSDSVKQFLKRPMYTAPKSTAEYEAIRSKTEYQVPATELFPDFQDPIDLLRMKEEQDSAAPSVISVAGPRRAEVWEKFIKVKKPFKEDPIVAGRPIDSIVDAFTAAANTASNIANESGQEVLLGPTNDPALREGRLDVSKDVKEAFLDELDHSSRNWDLDKKGQEETLDDLSRTYNVWFETMMRNFFMLRGEDCDPQTNPRLRIRKLYAAWVSKAVKRRMKMTRFKFGRWLKFKAKRIEKYGKKNADRRERGKIQRKEFRDLVENSPDWIYIRDWACWVEKKYLEHRHFQGLIISLQNNPSYSNAQKRGILQKSINFVKLADNLSPEAQENLDDVFNIDDLEEDPRPGRPSPPDDFTEDLTSFPTSYEDLIAAAEADMPADEIKRKYDPPANPYPKQPAQY